MAERMTLAGLRRFVELAERQGVSPDAEVSVVINGLPYVYAITGDNVYSSITNGPSLGVDRITGERDQLPKLPKLSTQ